MKALIILGQNLRNPFAFHILAISRFNAEKRLDYDLYTLELNWNMQKENFRYLPCCGSQSVFHARILFMIWLMV